MNDGFEMKLIYSEIMYKYYNSQLNIFKNSSNCFSCQILKLLLFQNSDTEVLFRKEGVVRFTKST